MKIEHFAINVPEPTAMAEWYVKHLGMRIIMASKEAPYMHFIADDVGSMIEIYNNPAAPMPDYANITLTPRGDKLLFLRDPWSVPFQFVQRSSPLL